MTIKYAATVNNLSDAWSFVMEKVEQVGPNPEIHIKPIWSANADSPLSDDDSWTRHFEVAVSGMVKEGER